MKLQRMLGIIFILIWLMAMGQLGNDALSDFVNKFIIISGTISGMIGVSLFRDSFEE